MADLPYSQNRGSGHGQSHLQGGHPAGGGYAMNDSAVWSDVGTDDGADMLPNQQYNSPYGAVRTNNNANTGMGNAHDPYADRSPVGGIGGGGGKGQYEKVHDPSYDAAETGDSDFVVKEKRPVHVATEVIATTRTRRWWIRITWFFTWWIPSFLLVHVGRMKRPDIRMAWREKVAIFMMVSLLCGTVLFYVIVFGRLLCPDMDKAWNPTELSTHQGRDDYYAAIQGKVYDFTTFYKGQHSDLSSYPTSSDVMLQFAGQDLTNYFPPPMTVACPGLVTNDQLFLQRANFTPILAYAVHTSGPLQPDNKTDLHQTSWYMDKLMPDLKQYYKGSLVYDVNDVSAQAESDSRQWAIYKSKVYDLSDYLYTENYYSSSSGTDLPNYSFIPEAISSVFQSNAGQDVTDRIDDAMQSLSTEQTQQVWTCLDNAFYVGQTDFRKTARCEVQNYILLALSVILCTVIGTKSLQLGSKRHPEIFDKFVICQVPCYTEGEESLKRTIDSLAVLNYDDKRKLIFIICDGNIIGSGNNRPTPRIVLDILGVDPKLDPEPLLFKSIGEGSKQLNYAKVYSGLYEFEGHVVPYIVVVKVGKPSETNRPGNRGKRDSQVLLMQYLNRVHFDAPMSPLELEIYHQMRNVIGIDPTFYEYIFQVDADTTVMPDSLNRLIACTSDDSTIIGICGETKLANERESLTTMIQVYEYFISHHLTKAFESLFGSVTCLPGCFSVYRIRTADKGRPVIISSVVIDEYAEPNVDTLHKKNLFSLGEDRYLTTLMMKHFPTFKMKFTPDAIAHTVAPSSWSVLLSQRRRWINSTVHNLVELMTLPELCGFCCFSMRFVVFIDLLGTIILPATFGYILYLIIVVSTGKAPLPLISIIMIAAVYGLQAIIFILKREFMLIGWMLLYILAFPIYSVWLPLYSFWSMDDFSWGNTRKVVGEGDKKTVVYENDEPFNDNMIPYKSFKEYEANAWETQSLHSEGSRHTDHSASVSQRGGDRASAYSYSRPRFPGGSRPNSTHSSSADLPAGADYWRDSSPLGPSHSSRNLRQQNSSSSLRPGSMAQGGMGMGSRMPSMAGMSMWNGMGPQTGSTYDLNSQQPLQPHMTGMSTGSMGMGMPMMSPMGMNGMNGMNMGMSMGSPMGMPMMPMNMNMGGGMMGSPSMVPQNPFDNQMGMANMGNMGMGGMGMGMGAPRNTVMTNLGGMADPGSAGEGGSVAGGQGGMDRGVSSYTLNTHPLAQSQGSNQGQVHGQGPGQGQGGMPEVNESPDPSDAEVVDALRAYLATQDLMRVTRRQTREAIYGLFPNANLKSRAGWVNENIDKVLSAES